MRNSSLHVDRLLRWEFAPAECAELQRDLRGRISRRWDGREIGIVAGTDVHFPDRGTALAVVVLMAFPGMTVLETSIEESPVRFPYIPGLLSFREIPPLYNAWRGLTRRPDVVLCDGQGIAHPRGLGLASHLGLVIDTPTIGCAKSPLFGSFDEPGTLKGKRTPIKDGAGKTIGTVLRTRDRVRPLYISVGHLVSLHAAVRIILSCTGRYRIPEPLRAAHRLAGGHDLL